MGKITTIREIIVNANKLESLMGLDIRYPTSYSSLVSFLVLTVMYVAFENASQPLVSAHQSTTAVPHMRYPLVGVTRSGVRFCGSHYFSPALRRTSATSRYVPAAAVCSAEPSAPSHHMKGVTLSSGVMRPSIWHERKVVRTEGRCGLAIWDGTPLELAWLPR